MKDLGYHMVIKCHNLKERQGMPKGKVTIGQTKNPKKPG